MAKILFVESDDVEANRVREKLCEHDLQLTATILENTDVTAPDLAIVSWDLMGAKSGAEIVGELHKRFPELPIFAASASWIVERIWKAKRLGACEFPSRPYDFKKLSEFIVKHTQLRSEPAMLAKIREKLIGESSAFVAVLRRLALIIEKDRHHLMITGENGTGKELLARAFHDCSRHANQPYVAINVAAVTETLIESELFGHEKGAFTGAIAHKVGAFERCGKGTLFLDEIGEASSAVQAKLLRAIQENEIQVVGGEVKDFEGRLVCATNRDLRQMVKLGQFREDLYYRLKKNEIQAVPLRERIGDVRILAKHFAKEISLDTSVAIESDAMKILEQYSFPGNVRQLRNTIDGALVMCNNNTIAVSDLPLEEMSEESEIAESLSSSTETPQREYEDLLNLPYKKAMTQVEQEFGRVYLPAILAKYRGIVLRAAKASGLDDKTFRKKWRECGLPPLNQ